MATLVWTVAGNRRKACWKRITSVVRKKYHFQKPVIGKTACPSNDPKITWVTSRSKVPHMCYTRSPVTTLHALFSEYCVLVFFSITGLITFSRMYWRNVQKVLSIIFPKYTHTLHLSGRGWDDWGAPGRSWKGNKITSPGALIMALMAGVNDQVTPANSKHGGGVLSN